MPKKLLVEALARLVEIELGAGQPDEAYRLAERAVQISPTSGEALVAHAFASMGLAQATPDVSRRGELQRQTERDLSYVLPGSPKYDYAQQMLREMRKPDAPRP